MQVFRFMSLGKYISLACLTNLCQHSFIIVHVLQDSGIDLKGPEPGPSSRYFTFEIKLWLISEMCWEGGVTL